MDFKTNNTRIKIGEGKISGYLSIFLGVCSFLFTICLYFPNVLTTSDFRHLYTENFVEVFVFALLILGIGFALTSFILRKKADIALIGLVFISATLFLFYFFPGQTSEVSTLFTIGLDWLVLDIFFTSLIFIPLELFLPKRFDQTKFHPEWRTDLAYFIYSHLLVQILGIIIRTPAMISFSGLPIAEIQSKVSSIAFPIQLFLALLITDLFQWTIHFLFHKIPILWRFHAIHHSIKDIDWLAGSRIHIVDLIVVRSFTFIPIYVLGFSNAVFLTYLVWVSIQAVLAHSNTRLNFGFLKYILVTPQYHHWHHSANPEYYDKNFAIHFPFIDMIFGTYLDKGEEWPIETGLGDTEVPKGILKQTIHPFKRSKKSNP
ncbi:MAG: sterol desaturase family protein [Algoriphagus sp.]|uniref:sterol desaturase family protein n=1 Tax=Algoriphagus sp. TaxID=1872435 RepID=UPI0018541642|nr:sterol desaturase family protein [Algoriphagus sp.]NVJ84841.1 sterol desaturase family protein [Algoriphagus sp.]